MHTCLKIKETRESINRTIEDMGFLFLFIHYAEQKDDDSKKAYSKRSTIGQNDAKLYG